MVVSQLGRVTASHYGVFVGHGFQAGVCRGLELWRVASGSGEKRGKREERVILLLSWTLSVRHKIFLKSVTLLEVKHLKIFALGVLRYLAVLGHQEITWTTEAIG